jgi:hypothetical protein
MDRKTTFHYDRVRPVSQRLTDLRAGLQGIDPHACFAHWDRIRFNQWGAGEFRLPLWDRPIILTYPDFIPLDAKSQGELPSYQQALLLYYFITCDGYPILGEWISFSELPDGRFYNQAYQGYSGQSLVRFFGNELPAFCQAAESIGGHAPIITAMPHTFSRSYRWSL